MASVDIIHTDNEYANSIVPTGARLVYLGYDTGENTGNIVLRYKDSDGVFGNVSASSDIPIASTSVAGIVKIDGTSINIDGNGVINAVKQVKFAETIGTASGNFITVQPVIVDSSGNSTADGSSISVLCNWNLLATGSN